MMMSQFLARYGLFCSILLLNSIAVLLNHIDDTDETYGYWEPLHYLLYGIGMKTWEYSSQYAIRSYAFIYPLYMIGYVLKAGCGLDKIGLFYSFRAILAIFTTYSQTAFLSSITNCIPSTHKTLQRRYQAFTALFLLLAPGVFLASAAYLPSAVAMNCLMLAISSYLTNAYLWTIFWGSIAVIWTGWPFTGLLFLPMGLHMLYSQLTGDQPAIGNQSKTTSKHQPVVSQTSSKVSRSLFQHLAAIILFCLHGLIIVLLVLLPACLIDSYYYQLTSASHQLFLFPTSLQHLFSSIKLPIWNILIYNSSNHGDELYGIEPASYYVKNLFLNLGCAWVLVLLSPIIEVVIAMMRFISGVKNQISGQVGKLRILQVTMFLWLLILFSRPHKEERFMYPIYPLLALSAAATLSSALKLIDDLMQSMAASKSRLVLKLVSIGKTSKNVLLRAVLMLTMLLFVGRVGSNYRNYQGYLTLWRDIHHRLEVSTALYPSSPIKATSSQQYQVDHQHDQVRVVICLGNEWYTFPSHFFLPIMSTIGYVADAFHGILPAAFQDSTAQFNDDNREERSRYRPLSTCHYLVTSDVTLIKRYNDSKLDDGATSLQLIPRLTQRVIRGAKSHHGSQVYDLMKAYWLPWMNEEQFLEFKEYQFLEVMVAAATSAGQTVAKEERDLQRKETEKEKDGEEL